MRTSVTAGAQLRRSWQARRVSNPQPAVLETAALPIELLAFRRSRGSDPCGPTLSSFPRFANPKTGVRPLRGQTLLRQDLGDHARADGAAAFANREPQAFFHRDRRDQL